MIKWNCKFNIEDSTVQLATALVEAVAFKNVNGSASVDVVITDESKETIVKEYTVTFYREFKNLDEVYAELVTQFIDAEVI